MRLQPRPLVISSLAIAVLAGLSSCRIYDRAVVAMDPTTIRNPDMDAIDELEAREQGYFPQEGLPPEEKSAAGDAAMAEMAIPGYNGAPIPGYTPNTTQAPQEPEWPKPITKTQIPGYRPGPDTPNVGGNSGGSAPIPPAPSSGTPTYDPSLLRDLRQ